MASPPNPDPTPPPVQLDPLAALLSYVVPGLGQIYQGRVGKGLLFFLGLYLLFFYGMWMGQWKNVWLPETANLPPVFVGGQPLGGVPKAVAYRWQFLGQFWIGAAAWPAVYQYAVYDPNKAAGPVFGQFERMPDEKELNDLQRSGNKRWDLGWVYTVIAGVLNLLVIYDALAGPMFREAPRRGAWVEDEAEGEDASPVERPARTEPAAEPVPHAPPRPQPVATAPPQPPAPPRQEGGA